MIRLFSRGMTKVLRCKAALVSMLFASGALLGFADGPLDKSISINFAAGKNWTSDASLVSGEGEHGVYPVKGDLWNNVSPTASGITDQEGLIWSDGNPISGVKFSCYGINTWALDPVSANNILSTFLCFPGENTTGVKLSGLPRGYDCTLYLIYSADFGSKFIAPVVNGTHYSAANGVTVKDNAADWGSIQQVITWVRTNHQCVLQEGVNYLKIENPQLTDAGELYINSDFNVPSRDLNNRGDLAALQLILHPPRVTATCDGYKGAVNVDGGDAASTATKSAEVGETISATLRATPAPGYRFVCWEGDTSILSGSSAATDTEVTVETTGRRQLTAVFELIDAYTYVLSVNFSGGKGDDTSTSPVSGNGNYGAVPVKGDDWNNIQTHVTSGFSALRWNDGFILPGITESNESGGSWTVSANPQVNNIFHSFLTDGDDGSVTFTGFTRERGFPSTCTVYIYASVNGTVKFFPYSVNGVDYTFADGVVKQGSSNWGSSSYANSNQLVLGGDYLKVENVSVREDGSLVVGFHKLNTATVNSVRGPLAAVQVAFEVPSTFTVSASCDATMGSVQLGDGEAGASVSTTGTHAAQFSTTLRAIPAPGYVFSHWTGCTAVIDGSLDSSEVTVRTQLPAQLSPVFIPDAAVFSATWVGRGERGNLADRANWECRNSGGIVLENELPGERTDITVSGQVAFDWPKGQTLTYRSMTMDCVLTNDCDWSGFGATGFSGTVDLNGHTLNAGTLYGPGTITDTSDASATGTVNVVVAEGVSVTNVSAVLAGGVRLVKEGPGTFVAAAPNQTYTGGTDIAEGLFVLGTSQHPMGTGDGTCNVTVRKGATIDINHCYSTASAIYNYTDLAGTICISGVTRADSWNSNYAWHHDISLTDDATISGGYFYMGHPSRVNTLSLNGHTLTLDLTTGTGEAYASAVVTDATGGHIVVNDGSLQIGDQTDFSSVSVDFRGSAYVILFRDCPVTDFSYAAGRWWIHNDPRQVYVNGIYTAGVNRPPVTLNDGATLDVSALTDTWNADGLQPAVGKDSRDFREPGRVSFADDATIKIDVGERTMSPNTLLVAWTVKPANVEFEFAEPIDGMWLEGIETGVIVGTDRLPYIAVWSGKGDSSNPLDPANWACTNKLGEAVAGVPVLQTSIRIPENAAFNCPAATPIVCKEVHLPATIGGDCDWSGINALKMVGVLDLKGHRLTLSHLSGDCTITDTSTGDPGELHINVPAATQLVNPSVVFDGNLKVVKDGAGTFLLGSVPQSNVGGWEIAAGTVKASVSLANQSFGAFGSTVVIRNGATYDMNGQNDSRKYRFVLDGGTIDNTGAGIQLGYGCMGEIQLTTNSTLNVHSSFPLWGEVDLQGHELEGTIDLSKNLFLFVNAQNNGAFKNGTVNIKSGGWFQPNAQAGYVCDMRTVDFTLNAALNLASDANVRNLTMVYDSNAKNGSGKFNIFGVFTPSAHNYLNNFVLQDGATLNLANWEGTYDIATSVTGQTLGFVESETGPTVYVSLGDRKVPSDVKVVSWPVDDPPNVKFKAVPGSGYTLVKCEGGICAMRGFVIMFR